LRRVLKIGLWDCLRGLITGVFLGEIETDYLVEFEEMISLSVSESWRTAYPGAVVGIMALENVVNPKRSDVLDKKKRELENRLRSQVSTISDLKALPVIQAYDAYYKAFRKNYHVLFQLESIALKGKSIPDVAALVEAMFVAELKNMLLTAGHDLNALELPIRLDISKGHERYVMLNGREQTLKPGDMMITDRQGIISSVMYGPDRRTRITQDTKETLFVVYAPPGVGEDQVIHHLRDIRGYIELFSPDLDVGTLETYVARGK
jgi:DNA/RNA-binding domain of Phe-tRNA-synthetase-like protein